MARSPFARLTLSSFEPLDCKSLDVAAGTGLPDSWIVQVIERLPVFLSVSVFVRVWSAGTMNWSDVGLTSPRGVRSEKS